MVFALPLVMVLVGGGLIAYRTYNPLTMSKAKIQEREDVEEYLDCLVNNIRTNRIH